MSNPFKSAVLAGIGTAFGGWILAQIPGVRDMAKKQFSERPQTWLIVVSGLIAAIISMLTLLRARNA